MRFLLDCNVLIALTHSDHISHERATRWMQQTDGLFATCPITQGALIRFILRTRGGATIHEAKSFLEQVFSLPGHQFWPDGVSYSELPEIGVIGHKQVTDAYLVALARYNRSRLATLDEALAALHGDHAILIR